MLKTATAIALSLALSLCVGAASVWYVLDRPPGEGELTMGQWTGFPGLGTPNADAYSKARVAREGVLALGAAEGVAFTATRDADDGPLRFDCAYRLEGAAPAARFWTLYAATRNGPGRALVASAPISSRGLLRRADDSFALTVSRKVAPGNWLQVAGEGQMQLVLTLYDTPVTTGMELTQAAMPAIRRVGCDG